MLARLSSKWTGMVAQPANGRASEDGTAANNEVVEERLVRELTREHMQLLLNMADKPAAEPGQGETFMGLHLGLRVRALPLPFICLCTSSFAGDFSTACVPRLHEYDNMFVFSLSAH